MWFYFLGNALNIKIYYTNLLLLWILLTLCRVYEIYFIISRLSNRITNKITSTEEEVSLLVNTLVSCHIKKEVMF